MKLKISGSNETFDIENRLGRALLVIGNGKIEEVKPPVLPVKTEVEWKLTSSLDEKRLILHVSCPVCHRGNTGEGVTPFQHCGRVDQVPEELASKIRQHLAKRRPERKREQPPMNSGRVGWLE